MQNVGQNGGGEPKVSLQRATAEPSLTSSAPPDTMDEVRNKVHMEDNEEEEEVPEVMT